MPSTSLQLTWGWNEWQRRAGWFDSIIAEGNRIKINIKAKGGEIANRDWSWE